MSLSSTRRNLLRMFILYIVFGVCVSAFVLTRPDTQGRVKMSVADRRVINIKPYGSFHIYLKNPLFFVKSDYTVPAKISKVKLNSYDMTEYSAQYILNDTFMGYKPSLEFFPVQHEVDLKYFEDRISTTEDVFIRRDGWHLHGMECHPRYWVFIGNNPPRTANFSVPQYESVVCISHQHASDFGHWFLEIFPALITVPEEIIHRSMIALPELHPFILEHLSMLDISAHQLIIGIDKPYFAKKYYTMHPGFCGDINKGLIRNMRAFFVKRLNLDLRKPEDFIFLHRKGMSRDIANLEDLLNACKEKWPQFPWRIANITHSIQDQARLFNNVSFVYSVHGSSLANTIFMQPGTVVVELQMENWLLSFIHLSFLVGLRHFVGRDITISWRDVKPNYIDIAYNLEIIKTALTNSGYISLSA